MKYSILLSIEISIILFSARELNAQWVQTSGLFDGQICGLVVKGDTIFAGSNSDGIFISYNKGGSWTAMNTGLTSKNIRYLVASGPDLFAGNAGGVFRSTDNGKNWDTVSVNISDTDIHVLIADSTHVFVGTSKGVFRSTDRGNLIFTR
jgi:ligand-binding sensor domain-containing protein